MNILLLFVCLLIISAVLGQGILSVLYLKKTQKTYMAEKLIAGWLVIIGLAQMAHLAAVFLDWAFSRAVYFFAAEVIAFSVFAGGIWLWSASKSTGQGNNRQKLRKHAGNKNNFMLTPFRFGLLLMFVLPVIWQIVTIMSDGMVYRTGDMMAETVDSFLETDRIYAVNPLTGSVYKDGIPLRIKILGLPTLYGALCSLFHLSATDLVWKFIPLWVLLMSYQAFWLLARRLFDNEKETDKRLLFMVFVALIFCVGDYMYGMDGFGILHCGFQGSVIRNVVLVPYTFFLALRSNWRTAVLVVLAEACITWTLYGMGVSLAVLLGMAVIRYIWQRTSSGFHDVGREA